MHPSPPAVARVLALVRAALASEAGGAPPTDPAPSVGVADLLEVASRHRVLELLHARSGELGLEQRYGAGLVDALTAVHAETRRRVAVQVLETRRLLALFESAELPALAVKGPALAVQSAGDVAARGFGDIDLFVPPAAVEPALALLAGNGWVPRRWGSAEPGTWAWRHLLGTFNEIAFDGPASTVDLHWRLDPNPGVLPDFDRAWERRALVDLGSAVVPCLDVETAFLHTCQHAAKDDWRWWRSLVDVHRLLRVPEVRDLVSTRLDAQGSHVRATVAVTRYVVGLPSGVEVPPPARRHARRAEQAQSRAVRPERPVPMAQSLRDLRYRVAASRTPRDLAVAVSSAAVPAPSVEGITDRTAWTAVPRLVLRRASWLVGQCLRWAVRRRRVEAAEPLGAPVLESAGP